MCFVIMSTIWLENTDVSYLQWFLLFLKLEITKKKNVSWNSFDFVIDDELRLGNCVVYSETFISKRCECLIEVIYNSTLRLHWMCSQVVGVVEDIDI